MCEIDVEKLLDDWGFPELIENFKKNDINPSNFFNLDEYFLRELIPSVGKRMRFLPIYNSAKLIHECSVQIENNENTELHKEINENENMDQKEELNLRQANLEFEENQSNKENIDQYYLIPTEHRQVAAVGLDLFKPIKMPDFDLNTLLSTDIFGREILEYYNVHTSFNDKKRNKITDIMIKHIFDYIAKHRLTPEDYNILTSKIIGLFPTESASTYYVPAIKKKDSKTGRSILARGKLVDKCRNLLHDCGPKVLMRKRSQTGNNSEYDELPNKKHKSTLLEDENIRNDRLWLQNYREPWAEVINKWKNTFEVRHLSTSSTVKEFYEEWPVLKYENADVLINVDFEKLFPQAILRLISSWDSTFEKIFEYKKITAKDKYCEELLTVLNSDSINEDSRFIAQLSILPYLIPPKGKINLGNRNIWKFSTAETIVSLICHAKIPGDIDRTIKSNKHAAYLRKQTVQPYLIVEGPSLYELNNFYIVIDELRYHCKSAKQAFDTCFKLYFVANAQYPPPAEHIYLLIQQGIYNIKTKNDNTIPYIMDTIEILKNQ